MNKKYEFVKPIMHIDKFFRLADYLIKGDDEEMNELGRAMRNAYTNQMVEAEARDEERAKANVDDITKHGTQNPAECKTGACD